MPLLEPFWVIDEGALVASSLADVAQLLLVQSASRRKRQDDLAIGMKINVDGEGHVTTAGSRQGSHVSWFRLLVVAGGDNVDAQKTVKQLILRARPALDFVYADERHCSLTDIGVTLVNSVSEFGKTLTHIMQSKSSDQRVEAWCNKTVNIIGDIIDWARQRLVASWNAEEVEIVASDPDLSLALSSEVVYPKQSVARTIEPLWWEILDRAFKVWIEVMDAELGSFRVLPPGDISVAIKTVIELSHVRYIVPFRVAVISAEPHQGASDESGLERKARQYSLDVVRFKISQKWTKAVDATARSGLDTDTHRFFNGRDDERLFWTKIITSAETLTDGVFVFLIPLSSHEVACQSPQKLVVQELNFFATCLLGDKTQKLLLLGRTIAARSNRSSKVQVARVTSDLLEETDNLIQLESLTTDLDSLGTSKNGNSLEALGVFDGTVEVIGGSTCVKKDSLESLKGKTEVARVGIVINCMTETSDGDFRWTIKVEEYSSVISSLSVLGPCVEKLVGRLLTTCSNNSHRRHIFRLQSQLSQDGGDRPEVGDAQLIDQLLQIRHHGGAVFADNDSVTKVPWYEELCQMRVEGSRREVEVTSITSLKEVLSYRPSRNDIEIILAIRQCDNRGIIVRIKSKVADKFVRGYDQFGARVSNEELLSSRSHCQRLDVSTQAHGHRIIRLKIGFMLHELRSDGIGERIQLGVGNSLGDYLLIIVRGLEDDFLGCDPVWMLRRMQSDTVSRVCWGVLDRGNSATGR
ncbi:hypothetical protein HG531_010739 [Fusarium graminearum]|nr:hypothetical protein HG531_010739 [Fusarium graminearum]